MLNNLIWLTAIIFWTTTMYRVIYPDWGFSPQELPTTTALIFLSLASVVLLKYLAHQRPHH